MTGNKKRVSGYQDLEVYQMAMDSAMSIFELTKTFPKEERYSLVDQIRRSSRSVCANIAEAFQKRIYPAAFVVKLSDANAEAAETQVWIEFAEKCCYMSATECENLRTQYGFIIGKLIKMMIHPEYWKVR